MIASVCTMLAEMFQQELRHAVFSIVAELLHQIQLF